MKIIFCKILKFILIIFSIFVIFSISYCHYISPTERVKFRVDLKLLYRGQKLSGTVVQRYYIGTSAIKLPAPVNNTPSGVVGQAMAINLENGNSIFVLMGLPRADGGWDLSREFSYAFLFQKVVDVKGAVGESDHEYVRKFGKLRGTFEIPQKLLPLMVIYTKPGDLDSAVRLYPRYPDFPSIGTLETDVVVESATLTITDEPVSEQISTNYPWLANKWDRPSLVPKDKYGDFSWSLSRILFVRKFDE